MAVTFHLLASRYKKPLRADPQARVWRGGRPPAQQGVHVLGLPIGHEEFVQAELRATTEKHKTLVERVPLVQDLQSAWLLLLFCANTHATCSLRGVLPAETERFAAAHNVATWARRQPVEDGRIRSSPRLWCVAVFYARFCPFFQVAVQKRSGQVATAGRTPWTPERIERTPPHIGLVGRMP